ncbi:MAG: hypothetical protein WEA34_14985 [Gemmatimonadota bacterium]
MSIQAAQLGPHRSIAVRWIRIVATLTVLIAPLLKPAGVEAQAQDVPPLRGQVLVGDSTLDAGTVVLHQVTSESQGEIDSVSVTPDGAFTFSLPEAPLGAADRFYFASIRHEGILYFGSALADVAQLDSIYRIQTYDTAMVASGGHPIPIQARNLFFEPNGEEWRVTDIFQLRNDEGRTLVAPDDGFVWRYPLLEGAREFSSGQDGFSLDGTTVEDGDVVVRAAVAPGERVFVFRYTVDEIFGPVATPGLTEAFDLLVREPSPRVGVDGLDLIGRVELEAGSTYRRYSATDVGPDRVRVVEAETPGDLPFEWITVVVALALAGAAIVVLRGFSTTETAGGVGGAGAVAGGARGRSAAADRQALLMEVARLDEAFEADPDPTDDERAAYERRRAELLGKLRAGS